MAYANQASAMQEQPAAAPGPGDVQRVSLNLLGR